MRVIGTAGHVDHGKSTLVRALTGIDPDRLKEEKARQMTIDLGFAWFTLPGGDLIGVVDVPGHRDFIENMLAGVGGIHAALFVIAADEGVMPQTREHLAILDLLKIPTGVIALTKIDMVRDADWLDLVQLDVLDVLGGTVLDGVPLVPVSARTGTGMDELRAALAAQLAATPEPKDFGKPRLWVDRVFSISGFGTVVTGTLLDGKLMVGQEIEFQPGGQHGRIRGLQTHNQSLDVAQPGSRVAVNVSGVEKRDVRRGVLLTLPGQIGSAGLVAARFQHLPGAERPLRHNAEVKFFTGSAETIARVRLLEAEMLAPGADGWIQLELAQALPLIKGDRFILRNPSPGETIGGGEIVEAGSARRYRRNRPQVIVSLEALARSSPAELVLHALQSAGIPLSPARISETTGLDREIINRELSEAGDSVVGLGDPPGELWIARSSLDSLLEQLLRSLEAHHKAEPLRAGIRVEMLRHQLGLGAAELDALLDYASEKQIIRRNGAGSVARFDFAVQLNRTQRAAVDRLMEAFVAAPYMPPSYKEAAEIVGEAVLTALIETGELVRVSLEVLLVPHILREFASETQQTLATEGQITIKVLRDRVTTSRKYAQAVLEYFDSLGITRRKGDDHVVGTGDWSRLIDRQVL